MGGRKKYTPPEDDGSGRGMMMFTTIMLILVTFFVVLVSRANFDESKYFSALSSIHQSFGVFSGGRVATGVDEGLPDQSLGFDQGGRLVLPEMDMSQIRALLAPALMSREANIIHAGGKRLVSLSAGLVFNLDSADINPEMAETLTVLADIIAERGLRVDVEGHTDNSQPQTSGLGDNWDISGRRAMAVMNFLAEAGEGIVPGQLTAMAYAGGKPFYSNATPQGRARNNRVDLVFDFSGVKLAGGPADLGDKSYNFQGFDFLLKNNFGETPEGWR